MRPRRHPGRPGCAAGVIRVVIADDHAVVRRGLRQVINSEPDLEVVADAANLSDARRYVRGHHPDVLVLDLNLPEGLSLNAFRTSGRSSRRPRSLCSRCRTSRPTRVRR